MYAENMEPSPEKTRRKHHKYFSADVNHAELERSLSEKEEQLVVPSKKLKSFTYAEKKKILEELNEILPEIICKKYDLSDRTLRYWKSQKGNIFANAKNINLRSARRIRGTQERDNQLLKWLVKNQNVGVPISGSLLKRQALIENKNLLGPSNFKASEGWLSGWKKRKNVRCLNITGEKLSADAAAAEEYTKGELPKLIASKQLNKKQMFNFEESCLYIKQMPDRTLTPRNMTTVPGTKTQFHRLTFGACCNADGSMKLPLVVIGNSAKPRCFKNLNMDQLPVFYRSQTNACMVTEIFEEWFTNHFVPQVKAFLESENLPLVAVLIVDRFKFHKYLKVDDIDVQFLPPHVTSLIQPCDQGILETIKLNYKINLVHSILESQTKGVSLLQFLKNVNVKDSVYWAAKAWNEVEPSTIIECWKKMLPIQTQDATTQTDGECSFDLLLLDSSVGTESVLIQKTNENVGKLVAAIRKVEGYEAISEKAIAGWLKKIDGDQQIKSESNKSTGRLDTGPSSCTTTNISSGNNSNLKTLIKYDIEETLDIKEEIVQDQERHQGEKHNFRSERNQLDEKCIASSSTSSNNNSGTNTLIKYDYDETLKIKEETVQDQQTKNELNKSTRRQDGGPYSYTATNISSGNNSIVNTSFKFDPDETLDIKQEMFPEKHKWEEQNLRSERNQLDEKYIIIEISSGNNSAAKTN